MSDAIVLSLLAVEAENLLALVDEFAALVQHDGTADSGLHRLAPDPYPDDEQASAEYRAATAADLQDRRLADARLVRRALQAPAIPASADPHATRPVRIDEDAADAWLRTLNGIRLVLAARLDGDGEGVDDPDDPRRLVYDWLGYRLDQLVALADERDRT